ncbi:hypothetical protein D3C80_2130420 [compost metagenome]
MLECRFGNLPDFVFFLEFDRLLIYDIDFVFAGYIQAPVVEKRHGLNLITNLHAKYMKLHAKTGGK